MAEEDILYLKGAVVGGCKGVGLVIGLLCLVAAGEARAECTAAEIREMIAQGLSDAEIDRRCDRGGALPEWLSGEWTVKRTVEKTDVPLARLRSPDIWRIRVAGAELEIAGVDPVAEALSEGAKAYDVRNVRVSGDRLSFATRENFFGRTIITTSYELDLSDEQDFVTGRYRSRDTDGMQESGTLQMIKRK